MRLTASSLALMLLLFASGSAAAFSITGVTPAVSGSVQTTVFDGLTTATDVPSTPLRVDPGRQIFEQDLDSDLINVAGSGFWTITGSMRWAGELNLDTVIGLESGGPHTARIFYELNTGDLTGRVFVPVEPLDAHGTISATLRSEYRVGSANLRTNYAFGILPDYFAISSEMTLDWRYIAASNQLIVDGVGMLDLGGSAANGGLTYEGWRADPQVSVGLAAVVVPEPSSTLLLGLGLVVLAAHRRELRE